MDVEEDDGGQCNSNGRGEVHAEEWGGRSKRGSSGVFFSRNLRSRCDNPCRKVANQTMDEAEATVRCVDSQSGEQLRLQVVQLDQGSVCRGVIRPGH